MFNNESFVPYIRFGLVLQSSILSLLIQILQLGWTSISWVNFVGSLGLQVRKVSFLPANTAYVQMARGFGLTFQLLKLITQFFFYRNSLLSLSCKS